MGEGRHRSTFCTLEQLHSTKAGGKRSKKLPRSPQAALKKLQASRVSLRCPGETWPCETAKQINNNGGLLTEGRSAEVKR